MPSAWIEALREYTAKHGGKYSVPKVGTKEHEEVKAIMERMKGSSSEAPKESPDSMPKAPKKEKVKAFIKRAL